MTHLRSRFTPEEWHRLEQRAARVAHAIHEQNTRERWQLLVVRLGSERYSLSTDVVRTVHPQISILPLPDIPAHIAGLANLRGNLATVLDVRPLLGLASADEDAPVLVELHIPNAHVALRVDEILRVDERFADTVDLFTGNNHSPYVNGVFEDGVVLLNIDAIINDPHLVVD